MIRWITAHPVAANLAMVFLLAIGFLSARSLPQTTFPEFTLDLINVSVQYPGASPVEIEQSIIRPIEDAVSGIDGIDEVTASATEGRGSVNMTLQLGEDPQTKLDEIKAEIDRIQVFPTEAEEPSVTQPSNNSLVLEIAVFGEVAESVLKEAAKTLDTELTRLPGLSSVASANTRDYEISIEVDRQALKAYGLTLQQIASTVGANSLELPGGQLDTSTLTLPLRTLGRNFVGQDFADIVLLSGLDGTQVRLSDVANIRDDFAQTDLSARYGETPAVSVNVYRVGDEQVLDIVEQVSAFLETYQDALPQGVQAEIWKNEAVELQNRLDLLISNAILGLTLVVICLALFLDIRLSFWSAVSIGISFVATFAVMAVMDMTINMISLFGFILAIGIVVDNAIVVGENVYLNNEQGKTPLQAAIEGAQRMAVPVIFSALTTVVAFLPLTQLPGVLGKFLTDIPLVVIFVLLISLTLSLLMLPRHLASMDVRPSAKPFFLVRWMRVIREPVDRGLKAFTDGPLDRILRFNTRHTSIPLASVIAMMVLTIGLMAHGYIRFSFFPSIEGQYVTLDLELEDGTAFANTQQRLNTFADLALQVGQELSEQQADGMPAVVENLYAVAGAGPAQGGPNAGAAASAGNIGHIVVRLSDAEVRTLPTATFEKAWRDAIGEVSGVKKMIISSSIVDAGAAIQLEASVPFGGDVQPVISALREAVESIPGTFDVRDDLSSGRTEITLQLKDEARAYGLSLQDLARQVRGGYYGIEATRIQRGPDDVKVFVRYPSADRDNLSDLLDTDIITASGHRIPLSSVADLAPGQSPTTINRRDGRTITTLTADIDSAVTTGQEANDYLSNEIIPQLLLDNPGLQIDFGGEQRTQGDAGAALGKFTGMAMFVIYALLALIFRSYIQPIVVMFAIPLGLIGAMAGHLIMGIDVGLLSIFGIIGLAGVVINNSLVMVDKYNEFLAEGMAMADAVVEGTKARFRPILLTSLTTFLGIFPLILEKSIQAQFLIPLAVSIGFGVLFGTVIILLSVPSLFMAIAKVRGLR